MLGNLKKNQSSSLITKEANIETAKTTNEEELDEGDIKLLHMIASIKTMDIQFLHTGSAELYISSKESNSTNLGKDFENNFELCQFIDDENFIAAPGISQDSWLLGRIIKDDLIPTSYLIERDKASSYTIENCTADDKLNTIYLLMHSDTGLNVCLYTSTKYLHN